MQVSFFYKKYLNNKLKVKELATYKNKILFTFLYFRSSFASIIEEHEERQMQTKAKALVSLTSAALFWALNPITLKILLSYGNAVSITILRFLLSSLTIFAFLAFKKKLRLPKLIHLEKLAMLGFFAICVNNNSLLIGLQYSTVSNMGIFNATVPFFIAMISFLFYKERMLTIQWLGILIISLSTIFILTSGNITEIFSMKFNKGDIIFLFAQTGWALYTIESAKLLREISLLELVAWSSLFGILFNAIYAFFTDQLEIPQFTTEVMLSLLYSVWISAMAGVLLWNYGVKILGPSVAGVFINLSTVMAIASGIIIYNEPLELSIVLGTLGIFLGIAFLVNYRTLQKWYKAYTVRKRLLHIKSVAKQQKKKEEENQINTRN